jgi:hypothetical protein
MGSDPAASEYRSGRGVILNRERPGNEQRTQIPVGRKAGGGERKHASNANNTWIGTKNAPGEANGSKTGATEGSPQTSGQSSKSDGRTSRAGAVQAVQARLGGDCRTDSERAGHAICMPVLSQVAPRAWSGAWV